MDDFVRHSITFFIMFFILYVTHRELYPRVLVAYFIMLPIIGELVQIDNPMFDFDVLDIYFNFTGALAGALLGMVTLWARRLLLLEAV